MQELQPLYVALQDAVSASLFLAFMFLWHKRTVARDEQFYRALEHFAGLLAECLEKCRDGDN